MLATYNGRAVRDLARADWQHRAPWQAVPDLAWLFLVDALFLQSLALGNLKAARMGLREYLPAIHGFDVLICLAGGFSILSILVTLRACCAVRIAAREKCVAPEAPGAATTLTGLALRDWEASRLTPPGLEAFSAMPVGNVCVSQTKADAGERPRHALAA